MKRKLIQGISIHRLFINYFYSGHYRRNRLRRAITAVIALLMLTNAQTWAMGPIPDPYKNSVVLVDTIPLKERTGDFITDDNRNPFDLKDPSIIKKEVTFDPLTGQYILTEKIGDQDYRPPTYLTFEEYMEYTAKQQDEQTFDQLAGVESAGDPLGISIDPIKKLGIDENKFIDRIFGGNSLNLDPKGRLDLSLGVRYQNLENGQLQERAQKVWTPLFDMKPQLNLNGSIGEKMKLDVNYNPASSFDFDRFLKLDYSSEDFDEDAIIRSIEAGNVSLPLQSQLIQGNQSLFGLKTELQFGRLRLISLLAQQQTEQRQLQIEKGAQIETFEVPIDKYDENRHFFLGHYFRDNFERSLVNLPQIQSLANITRVEVWITNDRRDARNTRQIMAISDLGESDKLSTDRIQATNDPSLRDILTGSSIADNEANDLYRRVSVDQIARDRGTSVQQLRSAYGLEPTRDYELVSARKLNANEFFLNRELGYISINTILEPDHVLGIAYEYTYNGEKFQVGELSTDFPNKAEETPVLFVKMLKSTTQRVDIPMWDLMMKNIYSIGAINVDRRDFYLDVFYEDPGAGEKRFLPGGSIAGQPMLRLLNLDNLNEVGDPQPDGQFDFVPGFTINLQNGRIMFPVLEPFGSSLGRQFDDPADAAQFIYPELYDSTVFVAREFQEKNRFTIRSRFKSTVSNEYSLGAFNVPRGSVRVTAGGQELIEGRDYDVDYNLGRVTIINEAYINSGVPINVGFEDNATFGTSRKTMIGLRADYELSKHSNIGFTYMHLFERPFSQKVDIGNDPINNRIIGLDFTYNKEAPWLTRVIDGFPLLSTSAPSTINFMIEGAVLKPGHSRAINQNNDDKGGVLYLDDFEGSSINIDLRTPTIAWVHASTPQNDDRNNNPLFPEGSLVDDIRSGVNRARFNWYRAEQNIRTDDDRRDPFTRAINRQEIFNSDQPPILNTGFQTFDLYYVPDERGPYNFDLPDGTDFSAGLEIDGSLSDPESRWGGIMRSLRNTDFQAANIEYIEFWMLNPFGEGIDESGNPRQLTDDGRLLINLGNISEDILLDGRMSYENGLPAPDEVRLLDTTAYGLVPVLDDISYAFGQEQAGQDAQDIGYDGLSDEQERIFYSDYLDAIEGSDFDLTLKAEFQEDPANDNFRHFRGEFEAGTRLFDRYEFFNNPQGNSRRSQGNTLQSSTFYPDKEDLNDDNTLNQAEAYFEYEIPITSDGSGELISNQFITDTVQSGENLWYRFQIPVDAFDRRVGSIQDFRSIRFMRMYMTGFDEPVLLRFATLDLVRNQWRRYTRKITSPGLEEPNNDNRGFDFSITSINIEENSEKNPVPYLLPPDIQQEQALGTFNNFRQNEQSLALNICGLPDGEAAAMFKNTNVDLRNYERLRMFAHAESADDPFLDNESLSIFMRIGSDPSLNYYEYEIPMRITDTAVVNSFRQLALRERVDTLLREIWPAENEFDFPLKLLTETKLERNSVGASFTEVYERIDPENDQNRVRVIGNPNLGIVKTLMIGVRNRRDDGRRHCMEVWVNELRVNGLNEDGGVAALSRLDIQLADFGRLSLNGNYSSVGFGAIDQRVAERSFDETLEYGVTTNLELGKLFPQKWGIQIPFYAQYQRTTLRPKFDPYDLDVELKDKLDAAQGEARDSIREQALDQTTIRSFNFTNVRKERSGGKVPMPWSVSNFSFTYAQSEIERSDPIIERNNTKQYKGGIDYNYSVPTKYIQPLKNVSKSKWLKPFTEFNFNPLPNSFTFNTLLDRQISERKYRFSEEPFNVWFTKRFTWDRNYTLNWDLSKSLKLRFNATMNAYVDEEPEFLLDSVGRNGETIFVDDALKKQTIRDNLQSFGRPKNYKHNINVSYQLPLQHFPFLDFMQVRAQVSADFNWAAAALNVDSLGNVIQNNQNRQINADLNFEKLYSKSKFLDKIQGRPRRGRSRGPRSLPGANNQDNQDQKKERAEGEVSGLTKALVRPLLMIRKGRFQYAENTGSVVPGFLPSPKLLGMNSDWSAPGAKYILGFRPDDQWFNDAENNEWITKNILLNQELFDNQDVKWNAGLTVEPYNDFRIELTMDYNFSQNHSEFFKVFERGGTQYDRRGARDVGSYTVSFFAIQTLFNSDIDALFTDFKDARDVISRRLYARNVENTFRPHTVDTVGGYAFGYGTLQRDVLIPAFLATYTGQNPENVDLDLFTGGNRLKPTVTPRPNWTVTLNGLSKLPFFEDIFQNISITHNYSSTLTVNTYNTDFDFDSLSTINEVTGDFYSRFEIPDLAIQEQFSPLIGVNITTKNDMSFTLNYNKSRQLNMSFSVPQLQETKRTDITAGFRYTAKDVFIPMFHSLKDKRSRKRSKDAEDKEEQDPNAPPSPGGNKKSDFKGNNLEFGVDFSFGENFSFFHRFTETVEERAQGNQGARNIRFSPTVRYDISKNISLQLFFNYSKNTPLVQNSFPITNMDGGLNLQFKLD